MCLPRDVRRPIALGLGGVLALASVSLAGMPPAPTQRVEARRIILLGMDSATWALLQPLMRMGRLPAWKRFVEESASAPLETLQPTASLPIWTTIVTGRKPEDHGLADWTNPKGGELTLTSNLRQVEALWTIFPRYRRSVAFLNWWGSWPAEETKGAVVSQRYAMDEDKRLWPETLAPLIQDVASPIFQGKMLPEALSGTLGLTSGMKGTGHVEQLASLSNWITSDDRTMLIGERLLREYAPDLTGIFLRGLDPAGHLLWHSLEPEGFRLPKDATASVRDVLPLYYDLYERYLTRILDAADAQTSILLVSDHGMYSRLREEKPRLFAGKGGKRMQLKAPFEQNQTRFIQTTGLHNQAPQGIFLAWGPMFQPGRLTEKVSVYDVTPTILAAMGMAVSREMPGHVVTQAFRPGVLRPTEFVPTYETSPRTKATAIPSRSDAAIREELKSLGYIGP